MNIYKLENGDIQLGDYRFRRDKKFTTVIYLITRSCNFNCTYCVGWYEKIQKDTLIDKFSIDRVVNDFRRLEQSTDQKLYVRLTGGEPTLISNFVEFLEVLTRYFFVGLDTNLSTKYICDFARRIDPQQIGTVYASYHEEILDGKPALEKLYFKNFESLIKREFSIALKIIAIPRRLINFEDKLKYLQSRLSKKFPILIQPFIDATYPSAYSISEKKILFKLLNVYGVHKNEGIDSINGAGHFKGMKCGAGSSFIMMDNLGSAYACHAAFRKKESLGNLTSHDIQFYNGPIPCSEDWCGTVLRALWFGVNPWDYLRKKREDCEYCRFA